MTEKDEHIVARLEERVSMMQASLNSLRDALREYVRMERYLRVEIAVLGTIGTVMSFFLLYLLNKILSLTP